MKIVCGLVVVKHYHGKPCPFNAKKIYVISVRSVCVLASLLVQVMWIFGDQLRKISHVEFIIDLEPFDLKLVIL